MFIALANILCKKRVTPTPSSPFPLTPWHKWCSVYHVKGDITKNMLSSKNRPQFAHMKKSPPPSHILYTVWQIQFFFLETAFYDFFLLLKNASEWQERMRAHEKKSTPLFRV